MADWIVAFIDWISTIVTFLSNVILIPGLSLLHFILACSIITMMVSTFISRGHE